MAARLQEKHFRETTDKEATRYVPFFQSLGLSKEQIQGLMDQMHQFHYSASKINLATQELSMQRDAYDTAVRQMLTPEQFAQYSAFERHRPALKETDAIETFLGQNLKVLTADARKGIADAVEKNNASTIVTWHGPYDPMPKVLVGREIIPFMEERIKRAEVGMEGLLKDLSGAMPADELELIKRYYESKLQEFRESIAMASMTKDQWTEKQQAEIEALMKKALKAP